MLKFKNTFFKNRKFTNDQKEMNLLIASLIVVSLPYYKEKSGCKIDFQRE